MDVMRCMDVMDNFSNSKSSMQSMQSIPSISTRQCDCEAEGTGAPVPELGAPSCGK